MAAPALPKTQSGTVDLEALLVQINDRAHTLTVDMSALRTKGETTDQAFVAMNQRLEALGAQIKALEEQQRVSATGVLPGLTDEVAKNGRINPLRALLDPNSRDWSIVREINMKQAQASPAIAEHRAATLGNDVNAGIWVNHELLPGFIDTARAKSVVWGRPGLTYYVVSGYPVTLPKAVADPAEPSYYGENEAPVSGDLMAGMIQFVPRFIRTPVMTYSNFLSSVNMQVNYAQHLENALRLTMANKLDKGILAGSGAAGEPVGIANTPNVQSFALGTNGGRWTFSAAAAMQLQVEVANLNDPSSEAFVMHPGARYTAKTERLPHFSGDTQGSYVALPMSEQAFRDHLGVDYAVTTNVAANLTKGSGTNLTSVYFGAWSEVNVVVWGDIMFRRSGEATTSSGNLWLQNQTAVYAQATYDVKLVRPRAFTVCSDAQSS